MKVMKFGGAAVRDGSSMRRVAAIVAAADGPRVVVTSAMHGVTDRLVASLRGVREDESSVFVLLDDLRRQHHEALGEVARDGDEAAAYAVNTALERLERLLYGIAYTQEATDRITDLVQSFGERLAAPVLAAALRAAGLKASAMDAEHAGIRSMGPFGNARPDMDNLRAETGANLLPLTDAGQVPVVTGFYGVDRDGHATLFGRGGSDYVAALLARALDADALELWKDVPGFLTTDPRAVPAARLVPSMGYDEAAELAHFGAKVLHPRCVEPLEDAGIPIHIRCFLDPEAAGTVVQQEVDHAPELVRSVACKGGLAMLRLNGPGMAYTPGVAKRVFNQLADAGVNVLNMSTSQATFALLLDEQDLRGAEDALRPLLGGVMQSIEALPGRSLVCVVGRGLGQTPGSAATILESVSRASVNVEMISLGASDIALDFIVQNEDAAAALQALHARFLETP
ncbi:MAG: aspartate kinase [Thermoplasmatota archaeon]